MFALSTVNGIGNWFHDTYVAAVAGENSFNAIDINWESHPEYKRQEGYDTLYDYMEALAPPIQVDDWEKITRSNISPRQWKQEYEATFLGTGDTFIDGEILAQLKGFVSDEYWRNYNNRMRV